MAKAALFKLASIAVAALALTACSKSVSVGVENTVGNENSLKTVEPAAVVGFFEHDDHAFFVFRSVESLHDWVPFGVHPKESCGGTLVCLARMSQRPDRLRLSCFVRSLRLKWGLNAPLRLLTRLLQ